MKNSPIKTLSQDIASRWVRVVTVLLLTAGCVTTLLLDVSPFWLSILRVTCIILIVAVIGTDTTRGLHHSKAATYVTALGFGLWLPALIDTFRFPPKTLFRIATESGSSFSFEIAPIVLITVTLLLVPVCGSIAYAIGAKRGDVRGVKSKKIFK